MADIFDWSSTPGSNTTVDSVNIAENCPPGNINNGMRSMMALIRNTFAMALKPFLSGAAPLPIVNGGTGAASVAAARAALGITDAGPITVNNGNWSGTPLSVANGGTGSTNAAAARAALGVLSATVSGGGASGSLILSNGFTLTWRTFTATPGVSSQAYGDSKAYGSWARAWLEAGGTSDSDLSIYISSVGTGSCTVVNAESTSYTCQLFSIGV